MTDNIKKGLADETPKTKISHTKNVKLMSPEFVQSRLEFLHKERQASPNDVNGMMDPQYVAADYYEGTATLKFVAKEWEMNRVGIMHGGVTSSILDHSAGCAVYNFLGHWCPTLDMDIRYLSQVCLGDELTCVGRVIHAGERFVTADAVLTNDPNGRLVAMGTMTYANGAKRAEGAIGDGVRHEG